MASACVNNAHLPLFSSPRLSFTRDAGSDPDPLAIIGSDPDPMDFIDFEFHLNDPVSIIPADELFSEGKLLPLHLAPVKMSDLDPDPTTKQQQQYPPETPRKQPFVIGSGSDLFTVSPRAPTCSSRWRDLLRRKRQQQQQQHQPTPKKSNPKTKSVGHFLNRSSRSGSESLPLLKDSEPEPPAVSVSTRQSVCGPEPDVTALDPQNMPNQNPILLNRNPPKHRVRHVPAQKPSELASAESPRMNASGKVVFQALGRSASSPSTFSGGTRVKSYQGMERSYSSNVRVTPVLNVPVCSLRGGSKSFGFGQLFPGSGANPKGGSSSKGKK